MVSRLVEQRKAFTPLLLWFFCCACVVSLLLSFSTVNTFLLNHISLSSPPMHALYLCSLFVGGLCTLRAFAILVVRLLPHIFETKRKAKHLNLNAEPQCIDCPCLRIQCWETLEERSALFCSANVNFLFFPSIQYVSFLILICYLFRIISCRHEVVTHLSGVRRQRHRPPDPESYITTAIPKLEHCPWKEGGA